MLPRNGVFNSRFAIFFSKGYTFFSACQDPVRSDRRQFHLSLSFCDIFAQNATGETTAAVAQQSRYFHETFVTFRCGARHTHTHRSQFYLIVVFVWPRTYGAHKHSKSSERAENCQGLNNGRSETFVHVYASMQQIQGFPGRSPVTRRTRENVEYLEKKNSPSIQFFFLFLLLNFSAFFRDFGAKIGRKIVTFVGIAFARMTKLSSYIRTHWANARRHQREQQKIKLTKRIWVKTKLHSISNRSALLERKYQQQCVSLLFSLHP